MGKKITSTTTPAETGLTAAKATKPAAKKAAALKKANSGAAFTADDIALRAYFIAEKRQTQGLPGDEHQDWVEAERQLAAEAGKKAAPKPRAKKAAAL